MHSKRSFTGMIKLKILKREGYPGLSLPERGQHNHQIPLKKEGRWLREREV